MLRTVATLALVLLLTNAPLRAQTPGADEPVSPLPMAAAADPGRVALGRRLFHDPRLSGNGQVACVSCHDVSRNGADSTPLSRGVSGPTRFNTPTVFNAALNFRQFWDGRAVSLEAQVEAVIADPAEMGASWPQVLDTLRADPQYRTEFRRAYPDGVTKQNVAHAIAAYERTLVTRDSRFDRFLNGDIGALDADERRGYQRFKDLGCVACHQGVNLGGNMFQRFGVWSVGERAVDAWRLPPVGRYRVTGRDADRMVFRVPSLRNVALTPPYFHDGSAQTLEDAIQMMFQFQLGRPGSPDDHAVIAKFLRTLTGTLPQ